MQIKRMKRTKTLKILTITLFLLIISGTGLLFPADVEVKASVNADKIGIDDILIYTISIKGISNPTAPDLSGLSTFKVTQTSSSFSTQIINGAFSQSVEFVYFLAPTKTGALNVPAVSYSHDGREYKTEPFTILVVKGSLNPAQPGRRRSVFDDDFFAPFRREQEQPQEIDIQLRAAVSKKKAVKGEQLIYQILLYTRNNIESVNMVSDQSLPGFWQEWYPVPQTIQSQAGSLDGKSYRVFEIRKAALFPTSVGAITIPAVKFELLLRENAFSFFADTRNVKRSTPEIKIDVAALPAAAEGLPVGDFDFAVDADKKEIDINDILTLRLKISGKGNIKTLEPPTFESGNYFKVYPAKISRDVRFNENNVSGSLAAEIPVSFKETGVISFPSLEFKYYNPDRGEAIVKNSNPFVIKVTGTKEKQESASTIPQTEIVKTGEDIDFIKKGDIYDQGKNFYKTILFKILCAIFFLINLLFILKIFVFDRFISQSVLIKKKKLLSKTLGNLGNIHEYGEIFPILENYIKGKAGLGLAEINNYSIESLFEKHGINNSDIKAFVRIKSESESARFSPRKKSPGEFKQDLELLIDILKRIDSKIK